ncbi:MAG TPA: class II aldolase/adducin family protein [Chthoniobacterales bacterium]|nr:class II aldolase/adducin family protein [Chthoniobacterales bacterium]
MNETGAVKFKCEHREVELMPFVEFAELQTARRRMQQLRLLGADEHGIGFGNVSVRQGGTECFYITGSGSGGLPALTLKDCSKVTAWDFERNWLRCEGRTIASAESLTHAAVYAMDADVGTVLHGHSRQLWRSLLDRGPATRREVPYGTPEMAREVQRLLAETDVRSRQLFAMAGHENGFVVFGKDVVAALALLGAQLDRTPSA